MPFQESPQQLVRVFHLFCKATTLTCASSGFGHCQNSGCKTEAKGFPLAAVCKGRSPEGKDIPHGFFFFFLSFFLNNWKQHTCCLTGPACPTSALPGTECLQAHRAMQAARALQEPSLVTPRAVLLGQHPGSLPPWHDQQRCSHQADTWSQRSKHSTSELWLQQCGWCKGKQCHTHPYRGCCTKITLLLPILRATDRF